MKKMILSVLILFTITGIIGCSGNTDFSTREQTEQERNDAINATSGMQVTITNLLPTINQGKPDLNIYFCCSLADGNHKEIDRCAQTDQKERCVRLNGVLHNGEKNFYHISAKDLKRISDLGNGQTEFMFADPYQVTPVPSPCWESDNFVLSHDFEIKQVWDIKVTKRNALSYGCEINRIDN
ncbi:MAG: hypothetical protein HQK53_19360 [Oligoflexia bacterium]|nr:hypothetical protein [Oligoflexia bacterium]